jgi:hypothetical protein
MPVKDIVDGFVLSASQTYQLMNYRSNVLAQMEVLRRAAAYRNRQYCVPNQLQQSVAAYSQVEQQISVQPGSYVWGLTFKQLTGEVNTIHIQLTDACTETPFFSDYAYGDNYKAVAAAAGAEVVHNPVMLGQPRLIGDPGLIDVEVYNNSASAITCQLVVLVAEPAIAPDQMEAYFQKQRIAGMIA